MITNKELTPKEKTIYVRDLGENTEVLVRVGEKTFGTSILSNKEELLTSAIERCNSSVAFFEQFSVTPDEASVEFKHNNAPSDVVKLPIIYTNDRN